MKVQTRLDAVTVYRQGALCEHVALVPAGAGPVLRCGPLPLSLLPGSLRANLDASAGGGRVLDVRAGWDVTLPPDAHLPAEVEALESAEAAVKGVEAQLHLLDQELKRTAKLEPRFPTVRKGAPPRAAPIEAMAALIAFAERRLEALQAERRRVAEEAVTARGRLEDLRARLQASGLADRTHRAKLARSAVITLSGPVEAEAALRIEYQVPGARWAPAYQLRLDRGLASGALQLRASVCQATGEDWDGVRLALSTALLERTSRVPELRSLRIGRTQPPPPRSGWREPPAGLDELFAGVDALSPPVALPPPPAPPPMPKAQPTPVREVAGGALARSRGMAMDDDGSAPPESDELEVAPKKVMARRPGAAPARPMPILAAPAPSRAPAPSMMLEEGAAADMAPPGGGGQPEEPEAPAPGFEVATFDYAQLVMSAWSRREVRGRLVPDTAREFDFAGVELDVQVVSACVVAARVRAEAIVSLPTPAGCRPVQEVDAFDYRYDAAARVDVPGTGVWTTIPVTTCELGLQPAWVCVPAVDPLVYRTVVVRNAGPRALLPGPVDVSVGDEFLLTAQLPAIPPGSGQQRLGLGVEEGIKVARKTNYRESTGGFLGASTVLTHDIEVEIANRLASPARLEIRERVPVPRGEEKDIKLEEAPTPTPWEKVEGLSDGEHIAGARRWVVTVSAGQKTTLTGQYTIRIPADRMLVGGNRRS